VNEQKITVTGWATKKPAGCLFFGSRYSCRRETALTKQGEQNGGMGYREQGIMGRFIGFSMGSIERSD
jgi:hypothetical protein